MPDSDAAPLGGFQVDLTNCDREPIHRLGGIQPFGFLMAFDAERRVAFASESVEGLLGWKPSELIGRPGADLFDQETAHALRGRLQIMQGPDDVERLFAMPVTTGGRLFNLAIHRSGDRIIVEGEPHDPDLAVEPTSAVRAMMLRVNGAPRERFFDEAARQVRALTGFDRVMVYRFDKTGSGEIIAEHARSGIGSFLGMHYPASDIPRQARALYVRNTIRIISDIHAVPSPIVPEAPGGEHPLDLSMSVLRSVSPIHIEYLNNMGVGASLSISIVLDGKLWGLFACHHYGPRHVSFERRTAAELFGQIFSVMLENRERGEALAHEARSRRVQEDLMRALARDEADFDNLADRLTDLCELVSCDGIGLGVSDRLQLTRSTPDEPQFRALQHFLSERAGDQVWATDSLIAEWPRGVEFLDKAAGLLAIPVSRNPRDYLIFFRKEAERTVNWGGDPHKPAELGPNGERLTPRKSFDLWKQEVRGRSLPWSAADLSLAESLRVTLLEVVMRLTDVTRDERRRAQERQTLLIAELNHRVRNILGLIKGLVRQSRSDATSVTGFANVLGGRIDALARAHDQITTDEWGPAPLRKLISQEASAYLLGRSDRVTMDGPEVLLDPQAFSAVALVVHELMTNSAKYGALCDSSGRVRVSWALDDRGDLKIGWREQGGPPVTAPTRRGFGTTIIEQTIPHDLRGLAEVDYKVAGLEARFSIPARFVREGQVRELPPSELSTAARRDGAPAPARALVVEDNLVIALDAEEMLRQLGVQEVDVAGGVKDALRLISIHKPDFALLDVNLGPETSAPVAERLRSLGVPFAFATGYGEDAGPVSGFAGVTVIKKPYTADSVARALEPVSA